MLSLLLHLALVSVAHAGCAGNLQVSIDGQSQSLPITGGQTNGVSVNGGSLSIDHSSQPRVYLGNDCSLGSNSFKKVILLGKTLSYNVNMRSVGCGCNAAFYLVQMPAINSNGNADKTRCGDYYCDANNVCGELCIEIDLQEANNNAWQTTPHNCPGWSKNGHYNNCDGGGYAKNLYKMNPGSYGWGKTIDTSRTFTVSHEFVGGSSWNQLINRFYQDGQLKLTVTHDNSGYLSPMSWAVSHGMTFTWSHWGDAGSGGDMSWLDQPPCGGEGCAGGTATWSNIKVGNGYTNYTHADAQFNSFTKNKPVFNLEW